MAPTDAHPPSESRAAFQAEQVRLLFGAMPATVAGTIAIALLLTAVLWPTVSYAPLAWWWGAVVVVLGARLGVWLAWRRRGEDGTAPGVWLRRFRLSLAVSGLLWTLATVLLFPEGDATAQAFFALVLAAVVAAATNTLTADRLSALVLMVPTVAPAVVRLAFEPAQVAHQIAAVLVLYFVFAFLSVARGERHIRDNARLRAEAEAQAERIRASAQSLRESEAHLSGISANLVGSCIYRLEFTPDGRMRCPYISPNVHDIIGVTVEDFRARPEVIFDLIDPEAVSRVRESMANYLRTGAGASIEVPVRHVNGARRWIQFRSRLGARRADGTQVRDGLATDITAAKETEAALRAAQQRLELALEAAKVCTWENDLVANRLVVDARWSVMLGGEPCELQSTSRAMLREVHPEDRAVVLDAAARVMAPGENTYRVQHRVQHRDGSWLWIESRGRVVERDREGRAVRVIGVNADISAQKDVEQLLERRIAERTRALTESERRHGTLLGNLQGMAYQCREDRRWTMQFVSEGCQRVLGLAPEELMSGRVSVADLVHPEDIGRVRREFDEALAAGRACQVEYRVRHADGSWRWVWEQGCGIRDEAGRVVAIEGYVSDVTERVLLEQQTRRTQRLESIGTLAGGIAHDLNNALAPVVTGVGLLRLEGSADRDVLATMEGSARRASEMVQHLLTFARGAEGARVVIDPAALVREMEGIVRSTFPKNIRLTMGVAGAVSPILGDATQVHQILLNLCVNARDAMPGGGELRIELSDTHLDATAAARLGRAEARPGHYVVLRVADTGRGIAAEHLERIYDPFFTTKAATGGSGLGLSIVLGIVRSHGGFLQVESQPGRGAVFSVHLPATTQAAPTATPGPGVEADWWAEGATVLFVDDEESVRRVAARVLERFGCRPILAGDGEEALAALERIGGAVDVVVTDLSMPRMDGVSLVRELRRRCVAAPVIVASGHLNDGAHAALLQLGVLRTLGKPFAVDELAGALRAALERRV